jgi:hypothetical protein
MKPDDRSRPNGRLGALITALTPLDGAIVVVRGDRWSANLCGRVRIGRDGADPYAIRLVDCGCHLHVDWSELDRFTYREEDVGYGPEPTVQLLDLTGRERVRIFFPPASRREVLLALRDVARWCAAAEQ